MKILVINAGSSSLKYQLIDMENESLLAKGLCERIGIDGRLTHKPQNGKPVYEADVPFPTHKEAIEAVLEKLTSKEYGVVETMAEIGAVGHRVLHGGIEFTESCVVDDACEAAIKKCFPLGPLHNPANLMGIKACQAAMPGVPQVAVFDTSFGMSMTPEAYIYAIPYEYYENDSIRRYGFHGTSHRFVSARACEIMGKKGTRVINCHLGNGSSVSASIDGKCVDTSMGLTPLEGLPMGTRSGNLDPAILQFIMNKYGYTADEMLNILNKKSGVLGISGVGSDFRDLCRRLPKRAMSARSSLSTSLPTRSVSISAPMRLPWAALISSRSPPASARTAPICARASARVSGSSASMWTTRRTRSAARRPTSPRPSSTVKVYVIPTNEELMIARDTLALVTK